jgi:hypothetical protein
MAWTVKPLTVAIGAKRLFFGVSNQTGPPPEKETAAPKALGSGGNSDSKGQQNSSPAKYRSPSPASSCIRAEIVGDDSCTALGITVSGNAPVLRLCRALVNAGHDPALPLHAFRGATLALKVRTIGEGARLIVKTAGNGKPIFGAAPDGAGAPPISPNENDSPATMEVRDTPRAA